MLINGASAFLPKMKEKDVIAGNEPAASSTLSTEGMTVMIKLFDALAPLGSIFDEDFRTLKKDLELGV